MAEGHDHLPAGRRRRYLLTAILATASLTASLSGLLPMSVAAILGIAASVVVVNAVLTMLATGLLRNTWWMRYAMATLDIALISMMAMIMRQDGVAVLYFLVIVPYSFDRGTALGYFTGTMAAVTFVGARGPRRKSPTRLPSCGRTSRPRSRRWHREKRTCVTSAALPTRQTARSARYSRAYGASPTSSPKRRQSRACIPARWRLSPRR